MLNFDAQGEAFHATFKNGLSSTLTCQGRGKAERFDPI